MQLGNDWAVGMLARGGWWSREVRETCLTPGSSFWKGGGKRIYLRRELTSNELYGSGWRPQKEGRKQGIRELTDMRNAMRPEVPPPLSTTRPPSGSWGRKEAQVTRPSSGRIILSFLLCQRRRKTELLNLLLIIKLSRTWAVWGSKKEQWFGERTPLGSPLRLSYSLKFLLIPAGTWEQFCQLNKNKQPKQTHPAVISWVHSS